MLAVFILSFAGCTSLKLRSELDANGLKAVAADVDEQIDNLNYVIHTTYERYKAAKREGGNRKEITDIEVELGKLQEVRRHLEAAQIRVQREIKGT